GDAQWLAAWVTERDGLGRARRADGLTSEDQRRRKESGNGAVQENGSSDLGRHSQIGPAIPGEITSCHRVSISVPARAVAYRGLKRSVAVPKQDRHRAGASIRNRQVGNPIRVEVACDDRERGQVGLVIGVGPEGAVALAQQNRNRTIKPIGKSEVELAVTVEVARGHRKWPVARGVVKVSAERAVAGAPEYGDRTDIAVG